jgi:hypothetical protein
LSSLAALSRWLALPSAALLAGYVAGIIEQTPERDGNYP